MDAPKEARTNQRWSARSEKPGRINPASLSENIPLVAMQLQGGAVTGFLEIHGLIEEFTLLYSLMFTW